MKVEIGVLRRDSLPGFRKLIPHGLYDLGEKFPDEYFFWGAVADGTACGVLVAALDDEARILHLYVPEDLRRQGIGGKLLDFFAAALPEPRSGYALRLNFAPGLPDAAADPLHALLQKRGFEFAATEDARFHTDLHSLSANPLWNQGKSTDPNILRYADLPADLTRRFFTKLVRSGAYIAPPFAENGISPAMSYAYVQGEEIMGLAVVSVRGGALEMSWLYFSRSMTKANLSLLQSVLEAARKAYPPETAVFGDALGPASLNLVQKLCPEAEFYPYLTATQPVREYQFHLAVRARIGELLQASESAASWWKEEV